jgi:hypothetical protein
MVPKAQGSKFIGSMVKQGIEIKNPISQNESWGFHYSNTTAS